MSASAEVKFRQAMAGAGRTPIGSTPQLKVVPTLRRGDVDIGEIDTGGVLGANLGKLLQGRLLIQGASGAGKSWTLRRLLEQTAGLIQQIVIDPEGEFRSLAEENELLVIDASKLDTAAITVVAQRAREHQLSLLVDLSELDREDQMKIFAPFITALVDAPKQHWFPCLVAVDEAHLFAPFGGQASEATSVRKAAIAALTDLMSRGRKRGLCGVLATQRLARLSKSVASEVHNFLIGINTLDLDIRRAAETIGWDARRGFDRLPTLTPGEFVAVGPAFSQNPAVLKVGPVATQHSGAAPELKRPDLLDPSAAAELLDLESLTEQSGRDRNQIEANPYRPVLRAVRSFIRDVAFADAGLVWSALLPLRPEGALIADLVSFLKIESDRVTSAIALLDNFAAVELVDVDGGRAVRIHPGFYE